MFRKECFASESFKTKTKGMSACLKVKEMSAMWKKMQEPQKQRYQETSEQQHDAYKKDKAVEQALCTNGKQAPTKSRESGDN